MDTLQLGLAIETDFSIGLGDFVKDQTNYLCNLWMDCDRKTGVLSQAYSNEQKSKNEAVLTDLLSWFVYQIDIAEKGVIDKKLLRNTAIEKVKKASKAIFCFTDEQVNSFEKLKIDQSIAAFAKRAREFNPWISMDEIFQAGRNVWTSNYLQVLMGLPVELNSSIFAYSMLYPVTDNYLDDVEITHSKKNAYSQRFRDWLHGYSVEPQNWNETDVLDLIRLIEGEYPRDQFSSLYDSLLAIHKAQHKSMCLPKLSKGIRSSELVSVTFEKGGTSVLADGFLAAGNLTLAQMEAFFNYGAFAQLMDDQEDLENDLKDRNLSFFTLAANKGKVDEVMDQVFNFAHQVLRGLDSFHGSSIDPIKEMSMKGIDFLLIDGILRTRKYYSNHYLQKMEIFYPVRFEYMEKVRKEIKKRKITGNRLSEVLGF